MSTNSLQNLGLLSTQDTTIKTVSKSLANTPVTYISDNKVSIDILSLSSNVFLCNQDTLVSKTTTASNMLPQQVQ
jgi:hypothetical protein